MAHIGAARLAELHRAGEPFPPLTEPHAATGFAHVLAPSEFYRGTLICGGDYIRFQCAECQSLLFEPNTHRGIAHARRVGIAHLGACCAERKAAWRDHRTEKAWPDPEGDS